MFLILNNVTLSLLKLLRAVVVFLLVLGRKCSLLNLCFISDSTSLSPFFISSSTFIVDSLDPLGVYQGSRPKSSYNRNNGLVNRFSGCLKYSVIQ